MDSNLIARVRQIAQGIDGGSPGDVQILSLNEQYELLIALASSPYEETTRMGRAFEVHTTSAIAAVVAVPTTANALSIYNAEPDGGGRSLIIDRVWALMAVGTAAAGQGSLIGCLGQTRVAALATASLVQTALNGMGGKDSRVINSTTALDAVTGVAGNWRLLPGQEGGSKPGAGATPGVYIDCQINGRIIVPPGRLFGVHVMADVVGSTFTVGIEWHEKLIKLG